ncbi:MAG: hypothetical protein FWD01_03355 [Defluviitaleaceae bacterium]|nr:hypothetical protein [Defluviitaleaceae bacterium]
MTFTELGSQDIKIAFLISLKTVSPDITVYMEHLPANPVFPHFHIIQLQTSIRQAPKMQIRNQWRMRNYFMTIKYREFNGLGLPPANLLARLDHIGELMKTNIEIIELGNAKHRLQNIRYEKEPDSGIGLMVGAFYCNVEFLVKIFHEPLPLQERLALEVKTQRGTLITKIAPNTAKK